MRYVARLYEFGYAPNSYFAKTEPNGGIRRPGEICTGLPRKNAQPDPRVHKFGDENSSPEFTGPTTYYYLIVIRN